MILTRETMKGTPRPVGKIVESSIPARLDALPWSHFHTLVIAALGITWVLDGFEVTLAGAVSGALKASPSLQLSDAEVGLSASAYLTGAVLGALLFGWLTDRFVRKLLGRRRTRRDRLEPVIAAWTTSSRHRLASGIRIGCRAWLGNSLPETLFAGKPTLAVAAWTDGRRRIHRRRRGARRARLCHRIGVAAAAAAKDSRPHGELRGSRHEPLSALPAPRGTWFRAHDLAGFLLQRNLLHLCAGAGSLLCRAAGGRGTLPVAVRREQLLGSSRSRPLLRHLGPPADDRYHLRALGSAARPYGHPLRRRLVERCDSDAGVDAGVLLRLRRGEFGLPRGQRKLSGRGASVIHRVLLCVGYRDRRDRCSVVVRGTHWNRGAGGDRMGLCAGCATDAGSGGRR